MTNNEGLLWLLLDGDNIFWVAAFTILFPLGIGAWVGLLTGSTTVIAITGVVVAVIIDVWLFAGAIALMAFKLST